MHSRPKVEYRRARPRDFYAFYSNRPTWPLVIGVMAVAEDVPIGMGGVHLDEAGNLFAFLDCRPKWLPDAMTLVRFTRKVLARVHRRFQAPILAAPDNRILTAKRFLKALGFRPYGHMGGTEVYAWTP